MKIDQLLGQAKWFRNSDIPANRNQPMQFDGTVRAKHRVTSRDANEILLTGQYYFNSYCVDVYFQWDYNPARRTDWTWLCVTSVEEKNSYPEVSTRYFIHRSEWESKCKSDGRKIKYTTGNM